MCGCCKRESKSSLDRLFEIGEAQLEKEMDMVKIIRSLRNLKVFIKDRVMDEKTKLDIYHSAKNIINIDSSSFSNSEDHDYSVDDQR